MRAIQAILHDFPGTFRVFPRRGRTHRVLKLRRRILLSFDQNVVGAAQVRDFPLPYIAYALYIPMSFLVQQSAGSR
jgi:hypothetical protein